MDLRKKRRALAGILLALAVCFGAAAAPAETTMHREADDPAIEMTAEIGYQGRITYGKAMPLRVRIRNNGGTDLEGTLGINGYLDTRRYNRYETEISVPAGAEMEYVLPFSVMTRQEVFTPEITSGGKVAEAVNIRVDKGRVIDPGNLVMVGVLSTKPNRLAGLNVSRADSEDSYRECWQTISLDRDTFPDDPALLNAFRVIVVDDVDPASLSEKQQEALKAWLEGPNVLLCSGTAPAVAYFSGRTGLEVTGAASGRQVLSALEILSDSSASGSRQQVAYATLAGAEPLADDGQGNGLVFRTETGNGRIYTAAFEIGGSGLMNERSMRFFWQKVLNTYDSSLYYRLTDSYNSDAGAAVYPGGWTAVPVRSPMAPAVLACAAAPVLAWAAWMVLKRKGKQTWMWLAVPVLAAAAAGAVLLVSGGSDLNRPLVTYTENIVQLADGSTGSHTAITAAAPGPGTHSFRLEGAQVTMDYDAYVYIDPDDRQEIAEPTEMAMCYTTGRGGQLAVKTDAPWETVQLRSDSTPAGFGKIGGEIWMEEDGLHGEVRNDTALAMKAGKVITTYGYVSVPALQPGEAAAFTLKKTVRQNPADYSAPADGEMAMNAGFDLYAVAAAAAGLSGDLWREDGLAATRRNVIVSALNTTTGGNAYGSTPAFLYSAETAESRPPKVSVDGKPAGNVAGESVVSAEITYLTTGRTGMVYRIPGMDRPMLMQTDENGMPAGPAEEAGGDKFDGGYSLAENPVFRFTLDPPSRAEVTSLEVTVEFYDTQPRCFLLNAETGNWDEIALSARISRPAPYVDAEGQLFCRLEPEGRIEYYVSIQAPKLTVEGRALHAED